MLIVLIKVHSTFCVTEHTNVIAQAFLLIYKLHAVHGVKHIVLCIGPNTMRFISPVQYTSTNVVNDLWLDTLCL